MFELPTAESVIATLLWLALAVYGFSALWWLAETAVLSRGWHPADEFEDELF